MTRSLPPNFVEAGSYLSQLEGAAPGLLGGKSTVVIIGAGYTGLSTAYHLAKTAQENAQNIDIVVLEAGKIGSGASGKSAGHVCPGFQQHDEAKVVGAFSTPERGQAIVDRFNNGPALVCEIIKDNNIDCDLRQGYVVIGADGSRTRYDEDLFAIEPYPYISGLADAARKLGVRILEDTPVKNIVDYGSTVEVQTSRGTFSAENVVCAGGHRMAETIPFLAPLRQKTMELLVTTIVTDPLPPAVLNKIMPEAKGERLPFATDVFDVSYGTVDRDGRIVFGAKAGAFDTDPEAIAARLFKIFPGLKEAYRTETGNDLTYKPYVHNEPLNFTAELLPNVGRLGQEGRVRYAHGLGGEGIAVGTMLGKVISEEVNGAREHNPALQQHFNDLACVKHMRLPSNAFMRKAVAACGLGLMTVAGLAQETVAHWKSKIGSTPQP